MDSMELTGFESRRNLRGMTGGMAAKKPEQPYSDFLTSLDRHGEPPSSGALERVLKGLRHDLKVEIRRRGLWDKSPRVLGMVGFERWDRWGFHSDLDGEGQEALDELSVDCYVYIFVTRLRSLLGQLETKGNVEGLVKRSVRNFVHDSQRKHDPLGFRVYKVFRRAVEQSVKERRLFILEEHRRLCNDTLLGFHPQARMQQERDEGADLTDAVTRWNDALLPDLMTAQGSQLKSVVETFQQKLLGLETEGVGSFRCRDVMDPLKSDARQRWATVWSRGDGRSLIGDHGSPMPLQVGVGSEGFQALSSCVGRRLSKFQGQQRTRNHLLKLWDYLKQYALADLNGEGPVSWDIVEEKLPSHRELAKTLNIPRDRFPELYETIRQATQRCLTQSKSSSALRVVPEAGPCAARRNAMKDRRDELLQRTGEAYQRLRDPASQKDLPAVSRIGTLYALKESSALGLEWLALEDDDAGCWHMVPADPHPWVGTMDLPLDGLGPLTLRCQQARWLDKKIFDRAHTTATLGDEQLGWVVEHMKDLEGAAELADDEQMETDDDPDYVEWCCQIQETTDSLACPDGKLRDDSEEEAAPRRRGGGLRGGRARGLEDGFLARAAVVLLAVGLTHWSGRWAEGLGQDAELDQLQAQHRAELTQVEAQGQDLLKQLGEKVRQGFAGGKTLALVDSVQVRGQAETIRISADDDWVIMLLELPPLEAGDRLLITRRGDGAVVLEDPDVGLDDNPEKNSQLIPVELLPEGDYRVQVLRKVGQDLDEIFGRDLRVVHT